MKRPDAQHIDLIARLDAVRETGPGRWLARCPAHDDRHPSLSVRHTEDGLWLLHCWAGCPTAEVVAALGIEMADLFPSSTNQHRRTSRGRAWPATDVLRVMSREAQIVAMAAEDIGAGRSLNDADPQRVLVAADRLLQAVEMVTGRGNA